MMYLDQPVSAGFLEVLRRRYPILKRREDFARLAGALLFPARIDDLTRRPVISSRYGALLEGVTFTEAYRAARFFEEFRSRVFDFDLSGWNFEMGRARELKSLHACPAILDAVRREVLIPKAGRDRLLATGEKITRRSRARARETAMATASAIPFAEAFAFPELADWPLYAGKLRDQLCENFHWSPAVFGELPGFTFRDASNRVRNGVIIHPLWSRDVIAGRLAASVAEAGDPDEVILADTFNLARRMSWAYRQWLQ